MPWTDLALRDLAEQEAAQAAAAREKHQSKLDKRLMKYIDGMQSIADIDRSQFKDSVHLDLLLSMIKPGLKSTSKMTKLVADIAQDVDVIEAICSAGGIASLVRVLEGFKDDAESAANAVRSLEHMFDNGKDKDVIWHGCVDAVAIPPVVAMLAAADDLQARYVAARLLVDFTFHDKDHKGAQRLVDAGAVPALLGALSHESNDRMVRSRAITSLANIACVPSFRAPIFEAMPLDVLEQLTHPMEGSNRPKRLLALLVEPAEEQLADGDGDHLKAATLLASLDGNERATPSEGAVGRARARLALLTKRASLGLSDLAVPDEFKCPISMCVMKDPVVASDGISYERAEIQRVLQQQPTRRVSPMTRERLDTKVFPNINLRKRIADHEEDVMRAAETSRAALSGDEVRLPAQKRARHA